MVVTGAVTRPRRMLVRGGREGGGGTRQIGGGHPKVSEWRAAHMPRREGCAKAHASRGQSMEQRTLSAPGRSGVAHSPWGHCGTRAVWVAPDVAWALCGHALWARTPLCGQRASRVGWCAGAHATCLWHSRSSWRERLQLRTFASGAQCSARVPRAQATHGASRVRHRHMLAKLVHN